MKIGDLELHDEDLATHIRIMGDSGMGKTTLLYSLLTQMVMEGEGFALLDPHEEIYKRLLSFLAYTDFRIEDVRLIDATARELTATVNPFGSSSEPDAIETKAQILTDLTLQVWGKDSEAVRAEKVLYVLYVALLEQKRPLADLLALLANPGIIQDQFARSEWEHLKGKASIDSVTTRLKPLMHSRLKALTSPNQAIDFPSLLNGDILLANLARSEIMGDRECKTLSAFLVAEIWAAAFARRRRNPPFYLVIDEFKMLASEELASVLTQAQKFGLHLIFLHQTERQLPPYMRDAIGNVSCFVRFLRKGEVEIHGWGSGTTITYLEPEPEIFDSPTLAESIQQFRQSVTIPPMSLVVEPVPVIEVKPTPSESAELPKTTPFRIGRGGEFHRSIQREIMKVAEGFGFTAQHEFPLENGTAIDLVLSKDDRSIACEVSVTTSSDWEAGNVSRCLGAGYQSVWVVVSDPKKVEGYTARILSSVPVIEQAKIRVLSLDRCFVELRKVADVDLPASKGKKLAGQRMTVEEVAEYFGVSETSIYRWKSEGRLPYIQVGRKILFDRDMILLIGRRDLTGKKRTTVELNQPIKIEKPKPKTKKQQDDRYRKMLNLD